MSKYAQKVLIIDDEEALRSTITMVLTDEGFPVVSAADGEEGLEVALRERPDLILLDITMPKVDGITMLKQLRAVDEWGKNVLVVMLTNSAVDDRILENIVDYHPSFYLAKAEMTPEDVIAKVKEVLKIMR